MYLHPLPTTGSITFSDFLITASFVPELAQATELRANVREILKSSAHSVEKEKESQESDGYGSHDWLTLVKAVDEYLPYLFSIFNCTQTDDLILKYEPGPYESDTKLSPEERKQKDERLKWSAENLCKASGVFDYLAETLIPKWEVDKGRIEGRPKDTTRECARALAKLTLADAQLLSIRKLLSPSLSHSIETLTPGPPLPSNHPSPSLLAKLYLNVESLYTGTSSLLKASGASASRSKTSAGSKTLSTSSSAFDMRSNPPGQSSSSRTPSKVFSKLKIGGSKNEKSNALDSRDSESFLEKERSRISNLELSTSSTVSALSISDSLLTYLSNSSSLSRSLAFKWLGIDAGENRNQIGQGICFLNTSLNGLLENQKELKEGKVLSKMGLGKGRIGKLVRDEMKRNRQMEVENVEHWKKSYVKLNDTVTFQPVPSASTLSSLVPAGRSSLNSKPFKPPQPTFGPGSPGFISEGMKRLGLEEGASRMDLGLGANDEDDRKTQEDEQKQLAISLGLDVGSEGTMTAPHTVSGSNSLNPEGHREEGNYAGAGAYY